MGLILLSPNKKWGGNGEPVNLNPDKIAFRFENGPLNGTGFYNEGSSVAPLSLVGTPKMISSPRRFGSFAADFRTGGLKFDPRFDHLLGSKDFTIEFNVFMTARGGVATFAILSTTDDVFNWGITLGNNDYNNAPFFFVNRFLQSAYWWGGQVNVGTVLGTNSWYHFSITRAGGEIYSHRNGVYQPSSLYVIGEGVPIEGDMSKAPTIEIATSQNMVMDDIWVHVGNAIRAKSNFNVVAL